MCMSLNFLVDPVLGSIKGINSVMYKFIFYCTMIGSIYSVAHADNFSSSDSKMLIESCREAVKLFADRDRPNFTAGLTTSLSEAMRAGYCIGMIEQYLAMTGRCNGLVNSWKPAAELIAQQNENIVHTVPQRLIEVNACG